MYGYDVVDHLKDRFSGEYEGSNPYISKFSILIRQKMPTSAYSFVIY